MSADAVGHWTIYTYNANSSIHWITFERHFSSVNIATNVANIGSLWVLDSIKVIEALENWNRSLVSPVAVPL